MSNVWLNIRFLFIHLQGDLNGRVSLSLNRWHVKRVRSWLIPISFYSFYLNHFKVKSFGLGISDKYISKSVNEVRG